MNPQLARAIRALRPPRLRRGLAALSALLAFAAPLAVRAAGVVINEFERAGALETIELYNAGGAAENLTGWTLKNGAGSTIPLAGAIAPGGFQTYNSSGFILEGGQIELIDGTLLSRDFVAYGDQGGAPLPPLTPGYSCGRFPNGFDSDDDASDWNLDPTATLASANDHNGAVLSGFASINELGPFSGPVPRGIVSCPQPVLELYNDTPLPITLDNWWLSDGRTVWTFDALGIPPNGFVVPGPPPPAFCPHETGVLYLFDPFGRRQDQIGIRGAPVPPGPDFTLQRVPDGAGPHDGWDYDSSGGDFQWLMLPETLGGTNGHAVSVGEPARESSWGRVKAGYR